MDRRGVVLELDAGEERQLVLRKEDLKQLIGELGLRHLLSKHLRRITQLVAVCRGANRG